MLTRSAAAINRNAGVLRMCAAVLTLDDRTSAGCADGAVLLCTSVWQYAPEPANYASYGGGGGYGGNYYPGEQSMHQVGLRRLVRVRAASCHLPRCRSARCTRMLCHTTRPCADCGLRKNGACFLVMMWNVFCAIRTTDTWRRATNRSTRQCRHRPGEGALKPPTA